MQKKEQRREKRQGGMSPASLPSLSHYFNPGEIPDDYCKTTFQSRAYKPRQLVVAGQLRLPSQETES